MDYKPYESYKKCNIEWLKEAPFHWKVIKLKFIADVLSSNVDKHVNDDEEPIKLCNYVDVYYNDLITSDINFMDGSATLDEILKFSLFPGDVLITKDSESWDDIAIPALVNEQIDNLVCGYHLALIRPNKDKIIGEFLYRCLASDVYNFQFQIAANGVTRYGLPKYAIDNAIIACPPINEQNFICEYLQKEDDKIFKLIDMLGGKESIKTASGDSMIGKLMTFRRSLINKAVTGAINLLDIHELS